MELFSQAFTIMVVGMALVFAFLAIVILAIELAARIIVRIEGVPVEEGGSAAVISPDNRRLAAIATAIHRFRNS